MIFYFFLLSFSFLPPLFLPHPSTHSIFPSLLVLIFFFLLKKEGEKEIYG